MFQLINDKREMQVDKTRYLIPFLYIYYNYLLDIMRQKQQKAAEKKAEDDKAAAAQAAKVVKVDPLKI
jgi:hypothetical protein